MDYLYIRAYGKLMGHEHRFITDELQMARDDKAPGNAIRKLDDGTWLTIESLNANDRLQVERLTAAIQNRNNPRTRTIN